MRTNIHIGAIPLIAVFLITNSFSQDKLFIPRNILSAYEKGTRSFDGEPGPEYWQNSSNYKIEVEFDPSTYLISGNEEITYHNNSPDSLKRIVLRLYPNVFKKGSARDYAINPEAVSEGVTIEKISLDGRSINLENRSIFNVMSAIAIIYLPKAVPPKSSTQLSINWGFKLSDKVTWRTGVYDSISAFVGHWYPQISVYDDIDGWDYNNYGGQEEFYNDFSSIEVSVTVPNNFGVWATGVLQNPEDVLQQKYLERFLNAKESDDVVRIISSEDLNSSEVFNYDNEKNVWKFKATNVTDFAFTISDHYLWDGLNSVIDSLSGKSVFIQAIYPSSSPDFKDIAETCKILANYFTYEMPAIKFPSPSLVVFNNGRAGGGMEFPMILNDGSPDIWEHSVALTAHEMAHQYFPFYVGTNESKYAFMDEAWAVLLPFKFMEEFAGINSRLLSTVANYEFIAGTEEDISPMVISQSLNYVSYRNSAYNRTSIAYEFLRDMIGDELFRQAIQEYISRWNGKHPTPYDFFFTFNNVIGQDLLWYWKPWFFEMGYPDLSIEKVEVENNNAKITVRKLGNVPTAIRLKIIYENETEEIYYRSAEIWKEGNELYSLQVELTGALKEINLGDLIIPDSNRENNSYLVH